MNIQLIQGQFNAKDAIDIIAQMIQVKVKYHESKISNTSNEEDIKFAEGKIKRLQNDLSEIRKFVGQSGATINIQSEITLIS
ncbi:hypothetical protein [Parasediminibacterium sp. JCM 36343]|uniref:hypothetical protein n=1 Tax=Parasediminibacterium sp. JCM 36343 TaxID=3374279 RepID=UPI00397C1A60